MPLPNIVSGKTRRCSALCRSTHTQCQNPAAYGMKTCRYHGARRHNTVKYGSAHPQFKHGKETKIAKFKRSKKLAEMYALENILIKFGKIQTKKTPGRKPRGC